MTLLIFITSLNTPVKRSKGKGKSRDNYPYFTDRGDCDKKVVQLGSLMSCGKREKKNPDLQKKKDIHSSSPGPLVCFYGFLTKGFLETWSGFSSKCVSNHIYASSTHWHASACAQCHWLRGKTWELYIPREMKPEWPNPMGCWSWNVSSIYNISSISWNWNKSSLLM